MVLKVGRITNINNVFAKEEHIKETTVANFAHVQKEGEKKYSGMV